MVQPNPDFGAAVRDALTWLGASPETAGALLGINGRTVGAMTQGIVPMRSLIIRFAGEIGRISESRGGAPAWWADPDAWLSLAGCQPRRSAGDLGGDPPLEPAPPQRVVPGSFRPPSPQRPGAMPPAPETGIEQTLAKEWYRPVYERKEWGGRVVHIFWIIDRNEDRAFQINLPGEMDYRDRAVQVKQDLSTLSRAQFDRKYGRYRLDP